MKIAGFLLATALFWASGLLHAEVSSLSGKVVETMDAGGYTYIKVDDKWAAVPKTQVKVGSIVTIENPMQMVDFESRSLKRKFSEIFFGTLASEPAAGSKGKSRGTAPGMTGKIFDLGKKGDNAVAAGMGEAQDMANPHGAMPSKSGADFKKIKVEKANGAQGKIVAEVYAGKTALKDKKIMVRGKAVKVNNSIMGKNWVHLQDGSGSEKGNDFDLLFTTTEQIKVGETVQFEGVVRLDRDLGAGYKYAVLIEDAVLKN